MPPRAPQVRRGPKTHATPTRADTHATDDGMHGAGPHGPCGKSRSLQADAAALGSPQTAPLELLGHAAHGRVEMKCCPSL